MLYISHTFIIYTFKAGPVHVHNKLQFNGVLKFVSFYYMDQWQALQSVSPDLHAQRKTTSRSTALVMKRAR